MKKLLTIYLLFVYSFVISQQPDKFIQKGNEYYKKLEFAKAESEYGKAVAAEPSGANAKFNLGNALYKQHKQEEAIKQFDDVVSNSGRADMKAKSYYNKGVVLSNQKKLEESIEAYKDALRQNPSDKEARENLQKALLEIKKKNPAKPKPDESKKKKQEKQQSSMSLKEAEQRLQLLAQKEKEVQQRMQHEKSKTGGSQSKDW
ncbi:MAG TPA: tetratricopeptide repeat protein [Chitinophagaceae bacterium]|nr:tetratricopeptide repeat protein [Chitinophagaceae bacterium]